MSARSAPTSPASRSAIPSASAAWSTAAGTAPPATRGWSSTASRAWSAPTTARPRTRPAIRWAAIRSASWCDERFRAAHPPPEGTAGRSGAAAVRRHHHLFAAAALEGRARQEGRHRRHRRAGPHGHQARARDGRARGGVHHLRIQARRSARPGRRRSGGVAQCRADEGARATASTSSSTPWRPATTSMRSPRCSSATAPWCWWACRSIAHPSPNIGNLIFKRRAIAGSLIGGIAETQEMLDFCAEHGIVADIEMIARAGHRRGLRADAQERREVPLRDRRRDDVRRRDCPQPLWIGGRIRMWISG